MVAALLGSASATFLESDRLAAEGLMKLSLHVAENGYPNAEQCTLKSVAVRREWYVQLMQIARPQYAHSYRSALRKSEKLDYIRAVKCLGSKPAKTPAAIASGAKSRYDDFVSVPTTGNVNILTLERGCHAYPSDDVRTRQRQLLVMASILCLGV